MVKSSTQSQSSQYSMTKKIVKKSAAKKGSAKKLATKKPAARKVPQQMQESTMNFWDKILEGNVLKVNAKIGKEEADCREQLALCYRVAAHEKLNEGCDNHFSIMLKVDGYDALLTLPFGI